MKKSLVSGFLVSVSLLGNLAQAYDFNASVLGLAGSPVGFQLIARAGRAARLVYNSGGNQSGTVGQPLSAPVLLLATDAFGNRVAGAQVTFAAGAGGGSIVAPALVTSDGGGLASATATLGAGAGAQTFIATAAFTTDAVTFAATARADLPRTLRRVSGSGQRGVSVDFRAQTAGASVNPSVATSDAGGTAQATRHSRAPPARTCLRRRSRVSRAR